MSERDFEIKDSGKRQEFSGGMVRDTSEGKRDYYRITEGPMLDRWAEHLTKGATKYPDISTGRANWTLADDNESLIRFKKSAIRHFMQWLKGDVDEDHAAAVFFNINGAEYVKGKTDDRRIERHGYPDSIARKIREIGRTHQESLAAKSPGTGATGSSVGGTILGAAGVQEISTGQSSAKSSSEDRGAGDANSESNVSFTGVLRTTGRVGSGG